MRRNPSILVLAAGLALAAAAHAQDRPPQGPPDMAAMHARMQAMHAAHARQRADDLRIILRLRPDQDGALTAFLAAEAPPAAPMDMKEPRAGENAPPPAMTTPQRLDAMARREAEHGEMRDRHVAALKTFYAALDPAQQKVFDALERLHQGPDGPHGMHGPGPGGPGGGPGGGWDHGPQGAPPPPPGA
jgi:protein CpxP